MKKPIKKKNNSRMKDKAWKTVNEKKYHSMVSEYQQAKTKLDELNVSSAEYETQNKICESLFNNAKNFFNQNQ